MRPEGQSPIESDPNEPDTPPPEDDTNPTEGNEPDNPGNGGSTGGFEALFGPPEMNSPAVINAPFGALYNLSDDVFIYGKRVDERVYPSGTAKLLTALAVYDALDAGFIFTVGDEIDMVSTGSGVAGLKKEQRLGMEAILTALLIPVGNDAAYTVSINTARAKSGDHSASNRELNDYFLRLMNDYAKQLGCQNSNFSNPDGFHANDNYSTVRDLTIIAAATTGNPMISAICGKLEHEVAFDSGEVASWTNSNSFLQLANWDVRGLRTGYTDESAFSAQILAYVDGKMYIAVVSGSPTAVARENDILRLLQLARDGYDADIINVFDS